MSIQACTSYYLHAGVGHRASLSLVVLVIPVLPHSGVFRFRYVRRVRRVCRVSRACRACPLLGPRDVRAGCEVHEWEGANAGGLL